MRLLVRILACLLLVASLGSAQVQTFPPSGGNPVGSPSPCAATQFAKTGAGGLWECADDPGAGTGAPTAAQYWTGAADGTLSAEKNLGALTTGLVLNTAGVPTTKAANTCTNQFARSDTASGVWTCSGVGAADITDGVITEADVAAANVDGLPETASMRTLGVGAQQAVAGDDVRLPSEAEKAAMADSATGTPPTSFNRFVVSDDIRLPAMTTPSALSAASQITCATPTMKISAASAITLSDAKWLVDGTYAGQSCELINAHATFTITGPTTATIKHCGGSGSVVIGSADETPLYVWDGSTWWQKGCVSLQRAVNVNPVFTLAACGTATNLMGDDGSGNKIEMCLTGTTPTLKMYCGGSECATMSLVNPIFGVSGGKPTCDATYAAANTMPIWITTGGAGVATLLQACSKNAADVYAWRTITLP